MSIFLTFGRIVDIVNTAQFRKRLFIRIGFLFASPLFAFFASVASVFSVHPMLNQLFRNILQKLHSIYKKNRYFPIIAQNLFSSISLLSSQSLNAVAIAIGLYPT